MSKVLLLDNYDSFTYNLEHYLSSLGAEVSVVRNDAFKGDVSAYDSVVLSPGPGLPADHMNLMQVIASCEGRIPVLGVCLGMQAIALHLQGELGNKDQVRHGAEDTISVVNGSGLFKGLPASYTVGLYHSWEVLRNENYQTDAVSGSDGTIMAISRPDKLLFGVQFHPESIMTEHGHDLLGNFLSIKKR